MNHAIQLLVRNWLVLMDPFSEYQCIHPTGFITTKSTIDLFEEEFGRFRYPRALVTHNATSFALKEFKAWCQERGITHLTGAPYHPGMHSTTECMVQYFKKSLMKSSLPLKRVLQEFLIQY